MSDRRVASHPILGPTPDGRAVSFTFDGEPIAGREGEPIAAALLAAGIRHLRRSERHDRPRSIFCGIGHCYECRVTVNGVAGQRACMTQVKEGMRVESRSTPPAEMGGQAV